MQVVEGVRALLAVAELHHDGAAFGGRHATLEDRARLVAVSARSADQVETGSLVLAGAGEGLLPFVLPLTFFGETLVAAVVAGDAAAGEGRERLAEREAHVLLDFGHRRAGRDAGAEGDHADDEAGGILALHDGLAGAAAAGDEGDGTGEASALIGAVGEDDGRVGAHALVRLVGGDVADRLGADLADAVLEVREDDQRVVGSVVLEDVDPAAHGAFLEVIGVLLVDGAALGRELVHVGLRRHELALGVLLGTAAGGAVEVRRPLELVAADDLIVMHVDEHAIAQIDVGVRELVADLGLDALKVRKHGG